MEVSKRALIITMIVNLLLLAIGVVCIIQLNYSILSLSLFLTTTVFIMLSSIFIWRMGQFYKKN